MIYGILYSIASVIMPKTDYDRPKWFAFSILCICLISYNLAQYNIFGSIFAAYMMISASILCMPRFNSIHFVYKEKREIGLESFSAKSLATIMMLSVTFLLLKKEMIIGVLEFLPIVLILNGLYCLLPERKRIYSKCGHNNRIVLFGICGNSSVTASLISLMMVASLHFFYENPYLVGAGLIGSIISLVRCKGAAGTIGAVVGLSIFFELPYFLLCLLPLYFVKDFYSGSGRKEIYKFAFDNIMRNENKFMWLNPHFFGIGSGAFQLIMPCIQRFKKSTKYGMVNRLHSDALQSIIEYGIIGASIGLVFYGSVAYKGYVDNNLVYLSFLGCWAVNSMFNFVHHMAPDSFLNILMLKYLYEI